MEKNQIKETITDIIEGREESAYYPGLIYDLNELNDIELDRLLVENFGKLYEAGCGSGLGDSWREKIGWIVEAEYPLEELPEHVRELAKKLYYDK